MAVVLRGVDDVRPLAVDASRLVRAGHVDRVIGTKGGVVLCWHGPLSQDTVQLSAGDFIFLSLDALPVPFAVEGAEERPDGSVKLHLRHVTTPEEGKLLCGCTALLERDRLPQGEEMDGADDVLEGDPEVLYEVLVGHPVEDQRGITLGIVTGVDIYSLNVVLSVRNAQGRELLLPYNDELLIHWPEGEQEPLRLVVPEGLVEEDAALELDE